MKISLPVRISANVLLPLLGQLGQPLAVGEAVVLDFTGLRHVTPAALVALVATVIRWRRENRPVEFQGMEQCAITSYLQRMDLFKTCGIDRPENFTRHDATGRFVPVRLIDHEVDAMGTAMALCLAPGGEEYGHEMSGVYDMAWYVLTEMANNVRQHSGGLGYASAQVTRNEGLVRLALADNGKGILGSFREAGLSWSTGMTDTEAIQKALEPRISSKGTPTNEGVGLTLVAELAEQAKAWLLIVSGRGVVRVIPEQGRLASVLPHDGVFPGTLVGLTFRQNEVRDFALLLHYAKIHAGLLPDAAGGATFRT